MDRTLILVKPDAFARGLTGEIIARFERKGLRIIALELQTLSRELAERHYAEHESKPFFGELVDFITSGPLVALVLEGHEAVRAARQVIGATNPLEALWQVCPFCETPIAADEETIGLRAATVTRRSRERRQPAP